METNCPTKRCSGREPAVWLRDKSGVRGGWLTPLIFALDHSMPMSDSDKDKVGWGPCCFCGRDIQQTDTDPCRVTVETVKGKWQVWVCHGSCFRSRITTATEIDLSPAHF
jgi:hypothetical protein